MTPTMEIKDHERYYGEEILSVNFYGRIINLINIPEFGNYKGVLLDDIITQLGLSENREKYLITTLDNPRYLAFMVRIEGEDEPVPVLPLYKLNAFLFSINLDQVPSDLWFEMEVVDEHGEILQETTNVRDNLELYQNECSMALFAYWTQGIAINTHEVPYNALSRQGSLWRTGRQNLEAMFPKFIEYAADMGNEYDLTLLQLGIQDMLCSFLPREVVVHPETCKNGRDVAALAILEDAIAKRMQVCILNSEDPSQLITVLDTELLTVMDNMRKKFMGIIQGFSG